MESEINHQNSQNSGPTHRVLFIITQSGGGGAQKFLFTLLNQISSRYNILVATGSDGDSELVEKLKTINIETTTIKSLRREMSPYKDITACFEIKDLIEKFRPNTMFLLSSKAGFIGSLTAKFLINNPRLKVIYRIGGWTFNDPWPKWKKKLWILLEKKSARWKDIIIVNNKHDYEQAQKLHIKPLEKLILVPNGIDPYKLYLLPRDEARLKLFEKISRKSGKVFQTDIIIGTIANLYPTKGIKFLIETAEYFKNDGRIIFTVIGDGPERKNLELLIANRQLQHKIFLLDQIEDAHKFMSGFDLFVLPSVKEGFPFVIIEAMAAKLPIVATRVGAMPEIIETGKNGFIVEPGNPAALASKIKELLINDRLSQEFSIQGHQTVLFNFTEDKMIKEIESIL